MPLERLRGTNIVSVEADPKVRDGLCCGSRRAPKGPMDYINQVGIMGQKGTMIEGVARREDIRRAYDFFSRFYGRVISPLENKPRKLALERATIHPGDRLLEVAIGPGVTLLEILKRVHKGNVVFGVDLSRGMLERARHLVEGEGYENVALVEADARTLPFAGDTFDVLLNSYMLDLIELRDLPLVIGEFRRVLKPGGRLVLVSMSKEDPATTTWWERVYTWLPRGWVAYLLGGCRPVFMEGLVREAGFVDVKREFVPNVIPSEVVTARKPDSLHQTFRDHVG